MGKVIGILSLKGGVGKTSVVSALGKVLSDFGKTVLLIDANFSAPNLGMHLNIINPEKSIHHVLSRLVNPSDAVHELDFFDLIPGTIFNNFKINPFDLKKRIKTLKNKYDVILIDSSPTLNDETLAVMLASDEMLVITTPDYPTLSITMKAIKQALDRGVKISGLILNKVHNKDFELSLDEIERTTGIPVMAVIPHDVNVLRALSEFTPSTYRNPKSEGSIEYKKLAATLIGEDYKPNTLKEFFRLSPRRQDINREIFYHRTFGD